MRRSRPLILCIDDDPLSRKGLEFSLAKLELVPRFADNPGEFLEIARKERPDLIIIGITVGEGEPGSELIREMHRDPGCDAPIIIISASRSSVTHAINLGATDFILKPMNKELLAAKLCQYLRSPALNEYQSSYLDLPDGRAPVKLSLAFEIAEIDELGLKLVGKHLISKGTVLHLGGDFMTELSGQPHPVLVTITSTWMEPDTRSCGAYAEFDPTNPAVLQAVRSWLVRHPS